jgi:fructokinase
LAKRADAVCFGTLAQRHPDSRHTIQTILSLVPESAFRIFDINIRQHYYSGELIEASLQQSNILKINDEELLLLKELFGKQKATDDEMCEELIEKYKLRYLILTAGAEYSKIFTPETSSHILTPKVEVADTVGAGDAFTGAFVSSIIDGKSLVESHQAAVDRAAFVCTRPGAWVSE